MRPISRVRFDALAGYARDPRTPVFAEELSYFEHAKERVLGVLVRDRTDNDFSGMVLARDERNQYRWVGSTTFHPRRRQAEALLRRELEQAALLPDESYHQGHKPCAPVDFFTPLVPRSQLHSAFRSLIEEERYSSARGIIEPMMSWYKDVDGNFIEQFQTRGFDARLWELYLFATLTELGFRIDREYPSPDFIARSLWGQVAIEAVTVNPTPVGAGTLGAPPNLYTEEGERAFRREYMPIKFGSSLYSKLLKQYWAKSHVRGLPLLFAIQDFSLPGSMTFSGTALSLYLYGYDHDWTRDEAGKLIVTPRRITVHRWGEKEVPSGFFQQPGAENVSAVVANFSGTISKFNRIGRMAGFGSKRVVMIRRGFAIDPDPNASEPLPFLHIVDSPDYSETWVQGCTVYHNPQATVPLDPELLPGATHLRLRDDGQVVPMARPEFHPLGSWTLLGLPDDRVGTVDAPSPPEEQG
jgi:hypothetical protein